VVKEIIALILMIAVPLFIASFKSKTLLGLFIAFIVIGGSFMRKIAQKEVFSAIEVRGTLFDEAFQRCILAELNEQDQMEFDQIKSLIFNKEEKIKSLSLFTEEEIFNFFLLVNQNNIFTPDKLNGKELLNLKLVLLLLTSLDRELGRDQELKEAAFDLYKKLNNLDEDVDKEFREKNIFCWNFFQRGYPAQYIKKIGLCETLKSFFNMSTPEYIKIVEYDSNLAFYKKLPFRMFGLFLAPFYKSYFPYYQVRDKRMKAIAEINNQYYVSP
jgi:hypothetical protein